MTALRHSAKYALVLALVALVFVTMNHLANGAMTFRNRLATTLSDNAASASATRVDKFEILAPDANFTLIVTFLPGGTCVAKMSNDCSTTGAGGDGVYSPTGAAVPLGAKTGILSSTAKLALSSVGGLLVNTVCDQTFAVAFDFYAGVIDDTASGTLNVIDGRVDVNSSGTVTVADDSTNISGRKIIDGYVDANSAGFIPSGVDGDGVINASDDGRIEHDLNVYDGLIDVNGDGAGNASDDGVIDPDVVSPDPIANPGNPDLILANDPDGNGMQNHVDHFPDYLLDILDPDGPGGSPVVFPRVRATADTIVAGTTVLLQFLPFDKGALAGLGGAPWSGYTAAKGFPSFTVLEDPTSSPPGKSQISDFCTPVTSTTTTYGVSLDNLNTVGPDESGAVMGKNAPPLGAATGDGTTASSGGVGNTGTHLQRQAGRSYRDIDGDGLENNFDTCPYDADTINPRVANGPDDDGLNDSCDPDDATACTNANQAPCDEDGDTWPNRLDNCPKVANATDNLGTPGVNEIQLDDDEDPWVEPADGGAPFDSVGAACDTAPGTADGTVILTELKVGVCMATSEPEDGDTGPGPDGWCDARETYVGTSTTNGCADDAAENADGHADTLAFPPDFNGDQQVTITDRTKLSLAIKSAAFEQRYDLDAGGTNNVTDRTILVSFIGVGVPDASTPGGIKRCSELVIGA